LDKQTPRAQDEFDEDLNPGGQGSDTTTDTPASDLKDMYDTLPQLTDDDLKSITVVAAGTRLEQGKTYLNLNDLSAGEFTGMASQSVGADDRLVAKDSVDYDLWNRLRGHEERTPQ